MKVCGIQTAISPAQLSVSVYLFIPVMVAVCGAVAQTTV